MQGSHSLLLSSVCSYQVVSEHSILGALEATRQKTMESRPENSALGEPEGKLRLEEIEKHWKRRRKPEEKKCRTRRHHAPTRRSGRRDKILKKMEEILVDLRSSISDLRKKSGVKETGETGKETRLEERSEQATMKEQREGGSPEETTPEESSPEALPENDAATVEMRTVCDGEIILSPWNERYDKSSRNSTADDSSSEELSEDSSPVAPCVGGTAMEVWFDGNGEERSLSFVGNACDVFGKEKDVCVGWSSRTLDLKFDSLGQAQNLILTPHQLLAILHDVFNIDDGGGSEDLLIIGEKVNKSKKGKTHEATHQVVEVSDYTSIRPGVEDFGPAILHGVIDIDNGYDSDDLVIIGEKISKSKTEKTEFSSSKLFSKTALNKKKSAASRHNGRGLNLSVGVESSKSESFLKSFGNKMKSARFDSKHRDLAVNSEVKNLLPPSAINFFMKQAVISRRSHHTIMSKFQNFKQFDFVKYASDHHFIRENSSMEQHSKSWVKVIQKEWKILEKSLPDSIFVRVYESRMDLLRAVIVGAEGTPYHNGLFCFDLYFPRDYPNVPPLVYSFSSHNGLNPVFGEEGRVCLSLLNTMLGTENERWLPRVSTILQVLVSIQGLVLNAMPFFHRLGGKDATTYNEVKRVAILYNERAFTHCLYMMNFIMRRPPKDFEDFVAGHFVSRAHDILGACNAYIEDVQVGSLFKDGACDVDEEHVAKKWGVCTHAQSVDAVRGCINRLVIELSRIGAKDCEKFLSAAIVKRGLHIYKYSETFGYA